MSPDCGEIQERLTDSGPAALRADPEARRHIAECESCYGFLEALLEVDGAFRTLPQLDPPDALVERALEALATAPADESRPRTAVPRRRPRWVLTSRPKIVGIVAVACLAVAVSWTLIPTARMNVEQRVTRAPAPSRESSELGALLREGAVVDEIARYEMEEDAPGPAELKSSNRSPSKTRPDLQGGFLAGRQRAKAVRKPAPAPDDSRALTELAERFLQSEAQRANEAFGYRAGREGGDKLDLAARSAHLERAPSLYRDPAASGRKEERAYGKRGVLRDALLAEEVPAAEPAILALSPAKRFQQERRSLEDLTFQPGSGYWGNTYVPGDPVLRWLEARLARTDPATLQAFSPVPLSLEGSARQPIQPFDPPGSAAMAVFLHSDRAGITGEGRALVQVGLQGGFRPSGARPPMNVSVVLDLRGEVPPGLGSSVRAVALAFLESKDTGDRFRLVVAGRPGAEIVAPDQFRHGPITVALSNLLESGPTDVRAPTLDLVEAVRLAAERARSSDDPTAPLGSSMVVLVTGQRLGGPTQALSDLAHQSAVAGVPVSVVGIGPTVDLDEIERVALAGQGNRRLMESAGDATSVVERELSSLSRVIARALRLRIRLAPGVKLIDVVGADRLDESGAIQVRQAERSIDRRLAQNLGIEADRGDEGVQIVLPTFYAGDSHVVLLDVVAPGPGPIADVTLRYKDLVYLRNGVARANLTLGSGGASEGALERNVLKNLLGIRLSRTLKDAGRALLAGDDGRAVALVREFRDLLASLEAEMQGFQNDLDLENDRNMLEEYLALLQPGLLQQVEPRGVLADSLQLAGYLKTLPSPSNPSPSHPERKRHP